MTESKISCDGIFCGTAPRRDGEYAGLYDYDPDFSREAFARGPGAFFWHHDRSILWIRLPVESPSIFSAWHIRPRQNHGGHSWDWDGNLEAPTLSPSLHWVGKWHGYMRAGRLESC